MLAAFADAADGGFFYTAVGPRATDRAAKGPARQRHAQRQRHGRHGTGAAGQTHRPRRLSRRGRHDAGERAADSGTRTDGRRSNAAGLRHAAGPDAGDRIGRGPGSADTARQCWPNCDNGSGPTASWPGCRRRASTPPVRWPRSWLENRRSAASRRCSSASNSPVRRRWSAARRRWPNCKQWPRFPAAGSERPGAELRGRAPRPSVLVRGDIERRIALEQAFGPFEQCRQAVGLLLGPQRQLLHQADFRIELSGEIARSSCMSTSQWAIEFGGANG